MILLCILILLGTSLLWWLGTLPWPLALILYLLAIATLVYIAVGRLLVYFKLRKDCQTYQAKWGGSFEHHSGLSLLPGQRVDLLISRRDQFLLTQEHFEAILPLIEVSGILALKGSDFEKLSDEQILHYLNTDDHRSLGMIRGQIMRSERLLQAHLFLIALQPGFTHSDQYSAFTGDVICLLFLQSKRNLLNLLKRPEIRGKAKLYRHHRWSF